MTIDEFQKVELKVAKVLSAERVEGSDKLIKLQLSLGDPSTDSTSSPQAGSGQAADRQVVAGIGKAYEPEQLVGKEIVIVANLDPRMMMGEESNGMLLAAQDADGKPVVLTVERDVSPGATIR